MDLIIWFVSGLNSKPNKCDAFLFRLQRKDEWKFHVNSMGLRLAQSLATWSLLVWALCATLLL